jgi:hypothetical protein
VKSWPGVRSFNLTVSFSLITEQCLALALIATNLSTSVISDGILLFLFLCGFQGCKASFYLFWLKSKEKRVVKNGEQKKVEAGKRS